jgi:hypothetical protein
MQYNNKHERSFIPKVCSIFEDAVITDISLLSNESNQYFKANGTFQGPGIYFTYELNGNKYKWNYKILPTAYKNAKVKKYCRDLLSTIDPKNPDKFDKVLNHIFSSEFYKDIQWMQKFCKNPKKVLSVLAKCSEEDKENTKDILKRTRLFIDTFNNKMQNAVVGKRTQVKVSSYSATSDKAKSPEDQDCLLTFRPSSYHKVNNQNVISSAAKQLSSMNMPERFDTFLPSRETIENFDECPF